MLLKLRKFIDYKQSFSFENLFRSKIDIYDENIRVETI